MILRAHAPDGLDYEIGDEIWHCSLGEAIAEQAQVVADQIAGYVVARFERRALIQSVIAEMTAALVQVGDSYRAPGGRLYSLVEASAGVETQGGRDRLGPMDTPSPIVAEVLRFEDLPVDALASRRAVVRWSDGTEGEAIRYYGEEVLSPVDRVGRR